MSAKRKITTTRRTKTRYPPKLKVCALCAQRIGDIDYKDISTLRRYISDRGKILSRGRTGACAKHQRAMAQAIKRARHLALLPYTLSHIERTGFG